MPPDIAGLTRHHTAGMVCLTLQANMQVCMASTNESCAECARPVCARHVRRHYEIKHPRKI